MAKPIAVCVSDLHFTAPTLEVASSALSMSIAAAGNLGAPLVIAGDLHNDKTIIRAEVANRLIDILKDVTVPIKILVGNHDLINEKGDEHGLNYLRPYADVIQAPYMDSRLGVGFIPYQNSVDKVREALKLFHPGDTLIMHQGVKGAWMGEYILDKTSIEVEALSPFKCISGHYHRHQTVGTLTYIGSPYTTSFAEANDGPKGCLVLYSDGSYKQHPFNDLRRHIIVEAKASDAKKPLWAVAYAPGDLLWLKITGTFTELEEINKKEIGERLFGHCNFKLDKICIGGEAADTLVSHRTDSELLDTIIDRTPEPLERKQELKALWRELLHARS